MISHLIIVDCDVHFPGLVVKIYARYVVWVLVVVSGPALPLNLVTSGIPPYIPLAHYAR